MRELQKSVKQFWNFADRGEIFLSLQDANDLARLLGKLAKEVREDK